MNRSGLKCVSLPIVAGIAAALVGACSGNEEEKCVPDCLGKACGDDGCGGVCGSCDDGRDCTNDTCFEGECRNSVQDFFCLIAGACVPAGTEAPDDPCQVCMPTLSQSGLSYLDDGSECGPSMYCYMGNCCNAGLNCKDKECGDDGCGGKCGTCGELTECKEGKCQAIPCEPDCKDKDCGGDGCGGTCGSCQDGYDCLDGACVCVPKCAGKECGDDQCGGSCGTCQGINLACTEGKCECAGEPCGDSCCGPGRVCAGDFCCTPDCEAKACGPDGCGGECGECKGTNVVCEDGACVCPGLVCDLGCCLQGQICNLEGECCNPQCDGKQCGPDGCGSLCGLCQPGQVCINGTCPAPGDECEDGNETGWDGCTAGKLTETLVNSWLPLYQTDPVVVSFPDGRFVVLWTSQDQDDNPEKGDGIFGQQYPVSGGPLGFEFQINTYVTDDQMNPAAAVFPDGRYAVVWQSWGQDSVGTGIFGQLYGAGGAKSGAEFPVNSYTMGDQQDPAVVIADNNHLLVAWSGSAEGDWNGISAQLVDSAGKGAGGPVLINTTTANEQQNVTLAQLFDGWTGEAPKPSSPSSLLAVWESTSQDGDGPGLFARLLDTTGQPTGTEFPVNTFTPGEQLNAAAAALPDNTFVIVWQSNGQDSDGYAVMAQLFKNDGTKIGSELLVNDYTQDHQRNPSIAVFPDGRFIVVYESKGQDGADNGIFARLFDASGTAQDASFQLNTHTFSIQASPSVATLPGNLFVAAWHGWEQGGEAYDVFVRRFTAEGAPLY